MKTLCRQWVSALERHPRLNPGLRILMAIFGGYGVAWLGAMALATGLPLSRPDAVALAVMLAFVLYLLFVLWVFATATLLRAASGLIVPALLFGTWLFFTPAATPEAANAARTDRAAGEIPQATGRAGREGRGGRPSADDSDL
ncbi:MAG: hypothetical protein LBQ81_13680 [Zoogloeaceae bacterium]|jgi:hypothetical protein|nr:hypothetical protein [Zoogloeaceae bacterium]